MDPISVICICFGVFMGCMYFHALILEPYFDKRRKVKELAKSALQR
jgi:hypothetical protein